MLRFISIGSGSSGNCYYLQTANDALLIDVGVGIRNLKKHLHNYNLRLDSVRHILITHDHADHVKSVGIVSTEYNIPVYATNEVHNGISRNYCVPKKIPADNVKCIAKSEQVKLGEFLVTPFSVPHDSTDNVGYKIVAQGVCFCLMTDIGIITDEMKTVIAEAQYLVIEANHDEEMLKNGPYSQHLKGRILGPRGHLSNTDCGKAIAENATSKLKHAWLCHLSDENNHPELAKKTVEQVLQSYGIIAGVDFSLDILKRKTPTGIYELKP